MKNTLSIRVGWLIDGSGGAIKENMALQIRSGMLTVLQPFEARGVAPSGHVDLSGWTILPGLVDAHVHLCMSGTADPAVRTWQLNASFQDMQAVIADHLQQHLACGILAVRDGGDSRAHALRYKTDCHLKNASPLALRVAGRAWRQPGRYGRLIGRTPQKMESLAAAILRDTTPIDHVKIVNSGLNSLTLFGKQTPPQFEAGELKQAVLAAKSRGLSVMVHANGRLPVKAAIEAGCDSIEHGFFMGRENLLRMADRQVTWVPTVFTMKAYADQLPHGSLEADVARKNLDHQLEQVAQARRIGVSVALGTDAGSLGVRHGYALIEELRLLQAAGFSVAQSVQCATDIGARLLGLKHTGLIKTQQSARFIAVKGDPLIALQGLSECRVFDSTGWVSLDR